MQSRQCSAHCVSPSGLDRMTRTDRGAHDRPHIPALVHGLTGPVFRPEN